MNRLRVLSAAHGDFLDAVKFYTDVSDELALDFVDRVAAAYQLIDASPRRYATLETNPTDREIRRIPVGRFPFIVVYEMMRDEPVVIAVQHTSRHPDFWLRP